MSPPLPTKPHRQRAREIAALVRSGVALRPLTGDAAWLVELLEHELARVYNDGLVRGRNAVVAPSADREALRTRETLPAPAGPDVVPLPAIPRDGPAAERFAQLVESGIPVTPLVVVDGDDKPATSAK